MQSYLLNPYVDPYISSYTIIIELIMVASISHAISEPGGSRNFLLTQYNMDRIMQFVITTNVSARRKM